MLHRDAEEQAEKIASEIENQASYKERSDLENGDEETRFAAVERPGANSPHGPKGILYFVVNRKPNPNPFLDGCKANFSTSLFAKKKKKIVYFFRIYPKH